MSQARKDSKPRWTPKGAQPQPRGELVFVRRIPEVEGTELELIDLVGRRGKGCRGQVLAAGPGTPLPNGGYLKPDVRKGDVVFFAAATGTDCSMSGYGDVTIMRASDILGVCDAP